MGYMRPSHICQVADFGLARSIEFKEKETARHPVLTDYVATRWYRAPEILLGSTEYTKGVDLWSTHCLYQTRDRFCICLITKVWDAFWANSSEVSPCSLERLP